MHNGIDHSAAAGVGGGTTVHPQPQPQPVQTQTPAPAPQPAQPQPQVPVATDTFERARPNPQQVAEAQRIAEAAKPENNQYVKWVKENLSDPATQTPHLNGADGKPSVQRAKNVYDFMNFYGDTLAGQGIDIRENKAAWKDMTWHTLHAFMDEAKTFSGDASFDFLGKRLTVHGEGTEKPTDEQVKKFMGHFYHISGHVTNRPDVKQGLERPEVKASLEAQGIDPKKPGNLIYWGNGGKVAGLNTGDAGYKPQIAGLNLTDASYAPQIAPLNVADSSYAPNISTLNLPATYSPRIAPLSLNDAGYSPQISQLDPRYFGNFGFNPVAQPTDWGTLFGGNPQSSFMPFGNCQLGQQQDAFSSDWQSQQFMSMYFQSMLRQMLLRSFFPWF